MFSNYECKLKKFDGTSQNFILRDRGFRGFRGFECENEEPLPKQPPSSTPTGRSPWGPPNACQSQKDPMNNIKFSMNNFRGAVMLVQARRKRHKPKLLSPDSFQWGRGLPREGWGQKVRYAPRNQANQTFLAGYPGVLRGYPAKVPEMSEQKKFVLDFRPLFVWGSRVVICRWGYKTRNRQTIKVTEKGLSRAQGGVTRKRLKT